MYNFKINKTFYLPITQLFDAFHKPDLISQWMAPSTMRVVHVVSDFEEGGMYRVVLEDTSGQSFLLHGEYTRIRRNDQLMFSWAWENLVAAPGVTSVDIQFEELDENTTEIILIHSGFTNESARDQHFSEWKRCLEKLPAIRFH
ncbi:SRPBCC domain-containing protein [Alteromonas ponticola]|uniref:SRPBCC domain-containing protein n=1 Tax=Alteromonas aquimaris TaxID=2998417 RepID=A0ABT3P410_9ALTE|nr:SRPBCC domain-containing protein [Alteromonas aquimaris]MCW8107500.1 SRPBCC domain-containing protein [Alteromonas aquimaris]